MGRTANEAKLVAAIRDLYIIGQKLYGRYTNDVAPNRADEMAKLNARLAQIAQPIIDRYPFEYGIEHSVLASPADHGGEHG